MNRKFPLPFSPGLVRSVCILAVLLLQASAAPVPLTPIYTGKGLLATSLRCEYLEDPLGIQETAPRLSWIVESGERGQSQTAYRLLVASSETLLRQNRADLWDSGKVSSDETIGTPYQGKALVSHQHCFWKVKVWDRNGRESAWSKPAFWSVGLFNAADWKAEWIGYDKGRHREFMDPSLEQAKWIWHAADNPGKVPKCKRLFISNFILPANAQIKHADLFASADDGMRFAINGHQAASTEARGDSWRTVNKTDVTARLRPGENELRVLVENAKEGDAGLIARIEVTTEDGQTFTHVTGAQWKSTDLLGDDWLAPTDAGPWPNVRAVADYGDKPWGKLKMAGLFLPAAPYFRSQFLIEKPITRATLYCTALGLADFYINGKPVSDDYFNPGWTDYAKRVYYRTYDVSALLRSGDNALGAVLADGWFSGYIGYRGARDLYGESTRLRAQLHVEYADGSTAEVGTGPNWKATTGPVLEADFLKGETYDARLERDGWSEPGCDDSQWDPVVCGCNEVHPVIQAHPGPAVRDVQEFRAIKISEPQPGVYVLDLGQNFAGVPRLKIAGEAGQKITLRFAERLKPDGNIYTANLRGARATDSYICKGKGTEIWQPRFTFHGFQYIEISGLKTKPAKDTVAGIALSSDTPVSSAFTCSDPMLNQLHQNIYWTQRANFIDIPTDCPQRDERLGWTGDAEIYVRTATLNTDVQAFFTKWLTDLEDGQREDGQFPCVAPVKVADADGGPAWADAGVICPWTIYEVYGDRRELERHYESMARFIEFCEKRSTPELLPPKRYHCYGDWLSIKADTPKDIIYTAYFAWSTRLMAQAARALGREEDASNYNALFERIRAAFNKEYVEADGRIKGHTQTCYAMALAFDLVQSERAGLAAKYLVEDIESRGWHLSTGFIGTKQLMAALTKIGRPDVGYRLIHSDTFPSWGFSIKQGATSIWERWDGWTPEKGFQDPGMNSFAHYSFGSVYQWMVENIGGIRDAAPTYKKIIIAPQTGDKINYASVSYRSVRGLIATDWRKSADKLLLKVTIPPNTTAQVLLPAKSEHDITESGKALGKTMGVKFNGIAGATARIQIGAGNYSFAAKTQPDL